MSTSPNLKVNVTADTSQFQKGLKGAQDEMKAFDKMTEGAADKLLGMFGVSTRQIKDTVDGIKGAGRALQQFGSTGTSAMGGLVSSIGSVGTALAGISVAGVIAQFKLLIDEAETWKGTIEGANYALMESAYINNFKQAMADRRNVGQATEEALFALRKGWVKFVEASKSIFIKAPSMGGMTALISSIADVKASAQNAETAAKLQVQINEARMKELETAGHVKDIEIEIAELRLIASDKTKSQAERLKAVQRAEELVNEKYDLQQSILSDILDATKEIHNQSSSSIADVQEEVNLETKLKDTEVARVNELRALKKAAASVGGTVKVPVVVDKEKERPDLVGEVVSLTDEVTASLTGKAEILVPLGIAPKTSEIEAVITDIASQIESTLNDTFNTLGDLIGGLVGDLLTGGDAWSNFANTAIAAMGDMAIKIGEMAISTGIATLGIKAALESLNGYAAIAAGVALVALGAAVKAGMSNIAARRSAGSVSSNVASSAVLSDYSELTDIKVEVTGTLVASGSQLVAVLNNEAKRKEHTT